MIGIERIITRRDGAYEPDPQGDYAVMAPVYDGECLDYWPANNERQSTSEA